MYFMARSSLYYQRHNAKIKKLLLACRSQWERTKSVIRSANLHPDLILIKNNDILILDKTVAYENGIDTLAPACQLKVEKYSGHANELSINDCTAKVEITVIGTLESWNLNSDKVIRRLGSNKYTKMMRKIQSSQ